MADLQSLLQKKKENLAKVQEQEKHDKGGAFIGNKDEEAEQLKNYMKLVRQADIENWYDALQEWTFKTIFIDLTIHQAQAIVEVTKLNRSGNSSAVNSEQLIVIKELEDEIDKEIKKFGNNGAFVKLSSRSAKDASAVSERTQNIFHQLIQHEINQGLSFSSMDENLLVILLNRAHIDALRVYSGQEALSLLTNSERVIEDLELGFEDKVNFSQKIVIREWVVLPLDFELRSFVKHRKMNALSQYYHYVYFPQLHSNKDSIQAKVLAFFEQIKDKVPFDSFVMDFGYDPSSDTLKIIELNPYSFSTSGCLFNWKDAKDLKILEEGPFELRIESQPYPNLFKQLSAPWKKLISDATERFK